MANRKTDLRALKTRRAIFEGLAELMCEKELRQITVQELSDKAEIHRVTFYKHFMDIYDVYEQLEKHILSEIGGLIVGFGNKPMVEVYAEVFGYIKKHPKYFKMAFSPHNTNTLYLKMLKLIMGFKRLVWAECLGVDMTDVRVESAIRYHCNGGFAVIGNWVQSDFARPQEEIIQTLSGLDRSTQAYLAEQLHQ